MSKLTPKTKTALRDRRHGRIRARVSGTPARPRLVVYRSNKFVSAQVIDDTVGKTLASARGAKGSLMTQAKAVGVAIAKVASAKGITKVVFDRGGYEYTGRIKALADAAREGGLQF